MLRGRDDARRLDATDRRCGHAARDDRILGVVLEAAAAERVAVDVERRREQHVDAVVARLRTHRGTDALDERRIPGRGEQGRDREGRGMEAARLAFAPRADAQARGTVGEHDRRDAEPRHGARHAARARHARTHRPVGGALHLRGQRQARERHADTDHEVDLLLGRERRDDLRQGVYPQAQHRRRRADGLCARKRDGSEPYRDGGKQDQRQTAGHGKPSARSEAVREDTESLAATPRSAVVTRLGGR